MNRICRRALMCLVMAAGIGGVARMAAAQFELRFDDPNPSGNSWDPSGPPRGIPDDVPPHQRQPLTASTSAVANGGNAFAFDLFSQLGADRPADENLLLSPFSISAALAMTYAGARHNTAAQIADALRFPSGAGQPHAGYGSWIADLNQQREGYELAVANRLFGQQGLSFEQPFLDQVAASYGAPLERLDFAGNHEGSRTHINDWVEGVTHDRIKDLIPDGAISPDTALVLTNALYFKGGWATQFDAEATQDKVFRLGAASAVISPTMGQTGAFRYGRFDGYRMLEMPYAGGDLSMVVVLPDAVDGLPALESSLSASAFQSSLDQLEHKAVAVSLPKFKIEDTSALSGALQDLGMTDAFSGAADFSGIADAPLQVSEVVHKTFLEIDERGTEAAAATAVIVMVTSNGLPGPPPIPEVFNADHPFLFALRDRHTGGLLFLGRMANPSGEPRPSDLAVPEPASAAMLLLAATVLRAARKSPYLIGRRGAAVPTG